MFGEDDRLKSLLEDLSKKGLHQKGMALFNKRIIKKLSLDNYEYTEDWEEVYISPVAYSVLQKMRELNNYTVIAIEKPSLTDLEPGTLNRAYVAAPSSD